VILHAVFVLYIFFSSLASFFYDSGQVVRHKQFSYRGVVAGWDMRPQMDVSNWEGVVNLPLGAEQPFYKVVPDEEDVQAFLGPGRFRKHFYVAQENLEPVSATRPEALRDALKPGDQNKPRRIDLRNDAFEVDHQDINYYFRDFDATQNKYIGAPKLRFCFPEKSSIRSQDECDTGSDGGAGDALTVDDVFSDGAEVDTSDIDALEKAAFDAIEDALLEIHLLVKHAFAASREEHMQKMLSQQRMAFLKTRSNKSLHDRNLMRRLEKVSGAWGTGSEATPSSSDCQTEASDRGRGRAAVVVDLEHLFLLMRLAGSREESAAAEKFILNSWLSHSSPQVNALMRLAMAVRGWLTI
jgi:hemimethylated DNA binding protein